MDGHSPILANTNPAVITYDPAYGYEIAHIVKRGIEHMYGHADEDHNVMYYLTVYNEPVHQPAEPEDLDVEGLHKGIYHFNTAEGGSIAANILASGVGVHEALRAQQMLADDFDVKASIFSVTSWNELARDGARRNKEALRKGEEPSEAFATSQLKGYEGPFVGVSDFTTELQEQIRPYVPGTYITLGADGFGFSDTRQAARRLFHIDGPSVAVRALQVLAAATDGLAGELVAEESPFGVQYLLARWA